MTIQNNKPVLAVPLGDAAGIGPEIVAKVAASGFLEEHSKPVIVGDESVLKKGIEIAGVDLEYKVAGSMEEAVTKDGLVLWHTDSLDADKVELARVTAENGKDQGDNLVACIEHCKKGLIEGFCFAPLNKAALKAAGYDYPSKHELFADVYGVRDHFGEMNVLDGLWNIRVTSHIPLSEVSSNITIPKILESVRLGNETLKRAGYERPRIAVAAINPHGGESGTCGREEIDVIEPAIEEARREGIEVSGPFPSDTLFIKAFQGEYDGVVTMYHDQGQIAIKLKGFYHCVTVSAGLPNAITTPAHGTAYDIAGKGVCQTSAFEDAYIIAAKMALSDRSV